MLARAKILPDALAHGFSDREGGVSEGPRATLNFGRKWGDDPAAVDENYRRLAAAAGFDLDRLCLLRQVHGDRVLGTRDLQEGSEGDALWSGRGDDRVVGVLTADCVPILLASADARIWAAVHSGWRGTVQGVLPATIAALVDAGVRPSELLMAIGPCIELAAFEVGEEVAEQFADRLVDRARARPHVDLVAAVRQQAIDAGVDPAKIERVGGCTHADPSRYYSYRRDGAGTGQHLAFIGPRSTGSRGRLRE